MSLEGDKSFVTVTLKSLGLYYYGTINPELKKRFIDSLNYLRKIGFFPNVHRRVKVTC